MLRRFAVLMILAGFSGMVAAGPFGVFGRRGGGNTGQQTGGGFASAAAAAAYMASAGRIGHFGGNPYPAEGVGMGSTAQQAIQNCCFYGRRQIADQGVAQGAGGMWFACNRYH